MQYLKLELKLINLITATLFVLSLYSCQHFSFYKGKNGKAGTQNNCQTVVMDKDGGNMLCVVTEGNVEMTYVSPWNQDIDAYGKYLCKTIDKWLQKHPFVDIISIPYPCKGTTISIDMYIRWDNILKIELHIPHNNFNVNEIIESLDEFYYYYATNDIRNKISKHSSNFYYLADEKTWK